MPCDGIITLDRFRDIGGPCEAGLVEARYVTCLPADSSASKAEEIATLAREAFGACRDFRRNDPVMLARLAIAIAEEDLDEVQQVIRDSRYVDEVLALMRAFECRR